MQLLPERGTGIALDNTRHKFHRDTQAPGGEDGAVLTRRKCPEGHEDEGVFVMETVMLLCAILASLALGVLVAYAICQTMFQVFRVHAVSAARHRSAAASSNLRVQQS